MRVPVSWLRAHCDPPAGADEIAERLAMTGTEVARVERVGVGSTEGFVVGRVLSAEPHPDADRLSVCAVDDGSSEGPRQIVCGAPNVAAGQTVAVARPGAVMPGGQALGEAKLRGVVSSGMILAEDEVGISDAHAEIMVLADGAAPGTPLADALPIIDQVLELEITPNRPDCLSVYGIARELHAATGAPLGPDPAAADAEAAGADTADDHASIRIEDPDVCLRFTGRVFSGVTIAESPLWLKQRLTAAGMRPIANVVDITNYVMLETGQPMHAFDLAAVRGRRISVRRARPGERMTTLDGVERELDPSVALVCDAEGPTSIAGIMGGQVSEVSARTTEVLMEAATWVGTNILRSSARLGLRSEASARFEKQLHPDGAMAAQRLAARLMVDLCGARLVPGTLDDFPDPPTPRRLVLRVERVRRLLGEAIAPAEVRAILERLGFGVSHNGGGPEVLAVDVPGFRDMDVRREADLVEEVARVHGLEKLPVTLPARPLAVGRLSPAQRLRRRVEDALRDRGMLEVIAWSFTSPDTLARLRLGGLPALRLANPLSEEGSVMRPLLLPGLLDAARHNASHGRAGVALFESAHVYRPAPAAPAPGRAGGLSDGLPGEPDASAGRPPAGALPALERHHLGGLVTAGAPRGWRSDAPPPDFFAARALLEGALDGLGVEWWTDAGERPFLHPGRAATVWAGADERKLGWIGELHPLVAGAWDLEGAAAFELDLDLLAELAPGPARYRDLTSFPAVLQDIAADVPDDVAAAEVEQAVRDGGGELLRSVRVFDLYRGEQLGAGRKSLALRLEFRAPDRTLTDDEVAALRGAIEGRLGEIGGKLRGQMTDGR